MTQAAYSTHGPIALISMNNPPVNGLGYELRSSIVAGLDQALADAAVRAVVLIGSAKAFSGGADIREFNSPKALAEPNLNTVIRIVESSSKPVIAAIGGVCMGGGLELALGCHFRVAVAGAQIALPEVKLGLLPGAGGTQRLPRLLGSEAALNMIVSGTREVREVQGHEAVRRDRRRRPAWPARWRSRARWSEKRALKLVRDLKVDYPNAQASCSSRATPSCRVAKNFPAPLKCVDAVAASSKPFDEGMARERSLRPSSAERPSRRPCATSSSASAPRPRSPTCRPTRPCATIKPVGVIGAGTMGGGIAMNFAERRHPGDHARDEAGGARPRLASSARTTRTPRRRAA
jgi:3-hydroxyacyl-CoA dehydrogenase